MKLIGLFLMLCLLVAFNKLYPAKQRPGNGNMLAGRDLIYTTPLFDAVKTEEKAPLLKGLNIIKCKLSAPMQ